MLRWRLLLGVLFIGLLVGLFWLDLRLPMPGTCLFPLAMLLALAAAGELIGLFAAAGMHVRSGVVYAGTLLVVLSNAVPLFVPTLLAGRLERLEWPCLAIVAALGMVFVAEVFDFRQPGGISVRMGLETLAIVYLGGLVSFVIQLRVVEPANPGLAPLVALISVVKLCDTGAYTFGRLFGRHKLAPKLSPGKTIEGAVGGLACACLGAWIVLRLARMKYFGPPLAGPSWDWVVFGLAVGTAGILGDLAKSLIKRDVGRKDSSTWMPGFGGVLDMIDSVLLAAPVAYVLWIVLYG
jgi:phosphatidate cytidylyltransferase